jgi:alpha-beta hydrolase superfamily lysophospholipase
MTPAPAERALYLPTAPDPTFGFLHPAAGEPREVAVLLCPPFGWEDFCSYRSRRAWADALAAEGYASLRIDLPATGDSGGDPRDPGRVEAWTTAVADAAAWLRASSGRPRLAVIGIGLGGLLACRALAGGAAIDDLVLWAVPRRGRRLLRELRAFARLNATEVDAEDAIARPAVPEPPPLPDGSLEVGGFMLAAETVGALEGLDLTELEFPHGGGRRALMLERDGIEVDRRLREHLEAAGIEVTVAPGPGYGAMMAHPQQARPPRREFATVSAWLAEAPTADAGTAPDADDALEAAELVHRERRIRETPLTVDRPCGRLWGVLCEPVDEPRAAGMTAILLNAGALRRIGPGRMWVELARDWAARGVPVLRIDLEGLGDSDGDPSPYTDTGALYSLALVDHVIAAMDDLEDRGLPPTFLLAGLCAGAYWSFHAALRDPRVVAVFALNPRALIWDESLDEERDARKIGGVIRGSSWWQVLRGEVSAARMRAIAGAALVAPFRARKAAAIRRTRRREVDRALTRMREAGKRLLLVFGGREPLHEELEREGRLSRLDRWPNMQLELLPGNDHSFRPIRSQQYVHAVLERALDRELERSGPVALATESQP